MIDEYMSYDLFKTKNFEKIIKLLHTSGTMDQKDFDLELSIQSLYSAVRKEPEEFENFQIYIVAIPGEHVDAFGTLLREGDRVVYSESGKYKYMRLGSVKSFSPKGVTIYIEGGAMTLNRPTGKVIKYVKE